MPKKNKKSLTHASSSIASYKCDILGGKLVYDDCSKFVNAVYYNYLLKKYGNVYGLSLMEGSSAYKENGIHIKILTDKKNNFGFKLFSYQQILKNNMRAQESDGEYTFFELRAGDLLYHGHNYYNDAGKKIFDAHVEFCIEDGGGKSFGWGWIKNDYANNEFSKQFIFDNEREWKYMLNIKGDVIGRGGIFNVANDELNNDIGIPYILVLRLVRDDDNYYME